MPRLLTIAAYCLNSLYLSRLPARITYNPHDYYVHRMVSQPVYQNAQTPTSLSRILSQKFSLLLEAFTDFTYTASFPVLGRNSWQNFLILDTLASNCAAESKKTQRCASVFCHHLMMYHPKLVSLLLTHLLKSSEEGPPTFIPPLARVLTQKRPVQITSLIMCSL